MNASPGPTDINNYVNFFLVFIELICTGKSIRYQNCYMIVE